MLSERATTERLEPREGATGLHTGPVSCVDMRSDGLLVTGGYDGALRLWGAAGRPRARLGSHRALVNAVAWSPDGRRVASASSDRTACVWDAAIGAAELHFAGHGDDVNAVCWSPDGRRIATASFDGVARVFDVASGRRLAELRGHDSDVNGVAWSPDGTLLATASDDGTVRLWTPEGAQLAVLRGHEDWVDQVAFSPDGALLASASLDRSARVWSVPHGTEVARLSGHACTVKAVRWSPDGRYLATAAYDKRLRIFERGSWRLLESLRDGTMWNRTLAWGRTGRIATGSFRRAPVQWRLGSARARSADPLGAPGINQLALSPDGCLAALACDDGGARLVELATGRLLRERFDHEGAVLCAAWSPDGTRVAFGGWDDRVSLSTLDERRPYAWLDGTGEPVNALAFSADGASLAVGSFMGVLSLADAESGKLRGRLGAHAGSIKSVAALPDGRGFLTGGRDGCLRLHGAAGPRALRVGETIVNGVGVSREGDRAACASRGRGVELWDLASGRCLHAFRDHPVSARSVSMAPDGRTVAAGYYDGHVLLWRPERGEARLLRPFGAAAVSTVAFAPGGRALVVASWDPSGLHGVLDVESGELVASRPLAGGGL